MANGLFGGGNGSVNSPYLIEDADDLNAIRTKGTSLYYKLKNNINLDISPYNVSTGWTPIPVFAGTIDGAGYVIKGLKINNPTVDRVGLFADLNGHIRDIGFVNVDIVADEKVGAIAGRIANNGVTIDRCYVTGTITGNNFIGGLIGESTERLSVKFMDCHSSVTLNIANDFAGGIIGSITSITNNSQNSINYCYYDGIINGGNLITAGPIYGRTNNMTMGDNLYNQEKILQVQDIEGCKPISAKELQDKITFDNWCYRYFNKQPIWRFIENNSPKLWYEDLALTLFYFDSGYNKFDPNTGEWVQISTSTPTLQDFLEHGMSKNIDIPIAKIKELESKQTIEVISAIESLAQGTNTKRKIELVFDKINSDKHLTLTTISEKSINNIKNDYTPISLSLSISQEDKKNYNKMNLEVISQTEDIINDNALTQLDNHIKTKALLIDADNEYENENTEKDINISNVIQIDRENEFIGFTDTTRKVSILSTEGKPIIGLKANIISETEKNIDAQQLINLKNHIQKKNLIIETAQKKEHQDISGALKYEIYRVFDNRDRAIHIDAKGEMKSRYLISVNNGSEWLTYNKSTGEWIDANLININTEGITISQMNDSNIWNALPTDYRSKIKFAVGIRGESFNSTHKLKGIDIDFESNNGPTIEDTSVIIKNNSIVVSGTLFDTENDSVEYQIITKQFSETEWRQITPEQPGWFKRQNGYKYLHEYEFSKFLAGDNSIKIIAKDSRGVITSKEFKVFLVTGSPSIVINSQNEFYMNATIGHTFGRKVRFRILVNNDQLSPKDGYTEWKDSPFTFDFSWDSKDLTQNLPNEIVIEAIDELNTSVRTKFHVIGGYRSLLFKDENNFYYSTDKGQILQQLDFGTVIGGLLTEPKVTYLENRTGLTMENVIIWVDNNTQEENVKLMLSETLNPFVPVESISYANTMANGDIKTFYARVESDIDARSIKRKVFKVYAKGDPMIV